MKQKTLIFKHHCIKCAKLHKPGAVVNFEVLIDDDGKYKHQYSCIKCDGYQHDSSYRGKPKMYNVFEDFKGGVNNGI